MVWAPTLAHDVLKRALRDGSAPAMSRWLREGTHNLEGWETDWSSQTGACQAGILHGDNHDMPAFRWWEKDRGQPIVTNHPKDATELERRRSEWAQPEPRYTTGVFAKYAATVGSASEGART